MLRSSMLVAALAVAVPVSALVAAPPTPEEIEAKTGAAMAYYREQGEKFDIESPEFIAVLDAQLADVDPAECNLEQIGAMMMLWMYSPEAKPAWVMRIREIGQGDEWLDAALMLAGMEETDAALEIGAMHGLAAVPDDRLGEVIGALGRMDDEQVVGMRWELEGLTARMPERGESLMGWMDYPALLGRAGSDKAARDGAREKLVVGLKATLESEDLDDRSKSRLGSVIAFLDGAAGRGELIGHAAPAVDITWNNAGEEWHCFRCLNDKVVVVDFWATWCGPCVSSFPDVRRLVDFYKGYDVVVLGLTSPQDDVFFRDERGKVTAADFKEECALMVDYAKAMDITWPIVMTEQDVFNTDFGVRGIPHVAIIGCDGKVAYNGLHPAGDLAKKVEKINGLLEKAGKKTPGPWKPKAEKASADRG